MTSGTRKPPPISTLSPRLTSTSRPRAREARTSRTAAALLLTTMADSAPQSRAITWAMRLWRDPALAGGEVELQVGGHRLLVDGERGAAEVGVEQHARGVDDAHEQAATEIFGELPRPGWITVGDGGAGGVDQQRLGQTGVGDRPGQAVHRGRAHVVNVAAGLPRTAGPASS